MILWTSGKSAALSMWLCLTTDTICHTLLMHCSSDDCLFLMQPYWELPDLGERDLAAVGWSKLYTATNFQYCLPALVIYEIRDCILVGIFPFWLLDRLLVFLKSSQGIKVIWIDLWVNWNQSKLLPDQMDVILACFDSLKWSTSKVPNFRLLEK